MDDDIESPCVRICVLDAGRSQCRGCYRTLDEISRWASYTRAEKLALLEVLARRKTSAPFLHHSQSA